ncbi:MAG: potassium transporter TrkG [Eubacterium sp.]|uniref:potassium transporter TrkG n=1 Tax=Eubacterium sp. TaxID=142586 RepID=UPI003994BD93
MCNIILIIVPTVYFYFFELSKGQWKNLSAPNRFLMSLFQSVTPRTAGFNTIDLNELSGAGELVTIILMLIGAAPGSTAGGMKVTTIAVLFATAFAVFRKKQDAHLCGRRIAIDVVKSASAILLMYTSLFVFGGIIISIADNVPIVTTLFESASAVATVGLSLGITPTLSVVSKVVLIILMFLGRVGGLTVMFAALSNKNLNVSRLPEENYGWIANRFTIFMWKNCRYRIVFG